jgi:hypothetical protein
MEKSFFGATTWRGDIRNTLRLTLLPCLATAAVLEQKLTGSDKGIWRFRPWSETAQNRGLTRRNRLHDRREFSRLPCFCHPTEFTGLQTDGWNS